MGSHCSGLLLERFVKVLWIWCLNDRYLVENLCQINCLAALEHSQNLHRLLYLNLKYNRKIS